MFRTLAAALLAALPLAAHAQEARGEAGAFSYYVLALSWSPSWCAREGEARGAPQCGRSLGWTLHGLWPQHEAGYPEYCASERRDPSRARTGAMADIMGSGGLAWHQWKKHGRCTGLGADDYFALSRVAYERVARPGLLRRIRRPVDLRPAVIEAAFLEANPGWGADMITITCRSGRIAEARLCLTRDLDPRRCGEDVIRDCARPARLDPVTGAD